MEEQTKSKSEFADACTSPLLVFIHGKSKKKSQTFYSLLKKRVFVRSIRELKNDYDCCPISQGGLILSDPDLNKIFLFNPATKAKIELPQLESKLSNYSDFLLSSPPTDHQYSCVVICRNFQLKHLLFCQLGGDKWVKYEYDLGEDYLNCVVACKGKFYGLTTRNSLLSIQLHPQPSLSMIGEMHNREVPVGLNWGTTFLVESCEEMYCLEAHFIPPTTMRIVQVFVYKFDFSKKGWEPVTSIGSDRIFLLSPHGFSASWSAREVGLKGDCIYFIEEEDKCLYAFDLEEGIVSTHLPCPKVPSPWCTPFWIMPVP